MNDRDGEVIARLAIGGRDEIDLLGSATVGRDPRPADGQAIEIDGDPLVSKSHFALAFEAGQPVIMDLGSSNGTFLHDAEGETPVPTDRWIPLPPDAEVEFGDQRMILVMVDVVEPTDAPPVPAIAPADPWGAEASGAPTDDSMTCANCERTLPAGSKFCDGCGTPTASPAPGAAAPVDAGVGPIDADDTPPSAAAVVPPIDAPSSGPVGPPVAHQPSAPVGAAPPGGPDFIDQQPAPKTGGPAKMIAIALAVIVVLALAVFGLTQVGGGGGGGESSALAEIPESVDEQWSEPAAEGNAFVGIGSDSVYTLSLDRDEAVVTSLSRPNGDENWTTDLRFDGLFGGISGEFGDVVVVHACDPDCELFGLDRSTGDELWSESVDDGFVFNQRGKLYVSNPDELEIIDPTDGSSLGRVRSERVERGGQYVLALDFDEVEVFDDDLHSILGPVDIPDRVTSVAFDGEHVIFAVGDELQLIDADGEVVLESSVGVDAIFDIRVVAPDNVLLSTDEGVLSVEPVDGRADERWAERGDLGIVADVDGGTVVFVEDETTDDIDVFDAESGDRRFTLDDAQSADHFVTPGRNAVVVVQLEGPGGGAETDIEAFEWMSGDRLWAESFENFVVFDQGAAATVSPSGDVLYYE